MRLGVLAALVLTLLAPELARSEPPADLVKLLVGKWDGQVVGPVRMLSRVLVVESVVERDGKWTAAGVFGDPGERLRRVTIALEVWTDDVILRFGDPGTNMSPIKLWLWREARQLVGGVRSVRGSDLPLTLGKVE